MQKSNIAIFSEAGKPIEFSECAIPELTEGQILVQNEYVTLCRSDISTYSGYRIEKSPTILGHEIVGRIVAIVPGEKPCDVYNNPLQVGDRITWAIYAANPDSFMSRRGIPQKSPDLFKYGHERVTENNTLHGGLAQHTILRKYTPVLPLPQEIPLKVAAIINCSVATVAGSLRLAGDLSGQKIAIWGVGMLGIIACAMCKERGAAEVIAIDINKERLEIAAQFGATSLMLSDEVSLPDIQADITIDYSGRIHSMESTVNVLAIGGTAVWVGGVCPQKKIELDSEMIIRRLCTVKGLHNYNTEDFKEAVSFIANNYKKYPIDKLIYDGFNLEQVNEAFQYAIQNNPYRVGISIGHHSL